MDNQLFLVCGFFLFSIVCSYVEAGQIPFRDGSPSFSKALKPIINEDIDAFMNEIIQNKSMKGVSMAIIRSDGETEFGSWGISTEYGDKVTPEVCSIILFPQLVLNCAFVLKDVIWSGIILPDIHLCGMGYSG